MRQCAKMIAGLLLLLVLCSCGHDYEAKAAGTWQGDGSLDTPEPAPFEFAYQWEFDGKGAAVATVNGKDMRFHYYMTDDTLTLSGDGEMSWGLPYELKGDTLRIGEAVFTKVR